MIFTSNVTSSWTVTSTVLPQSKPLVIPNFEYDFGQVKLNLSLDEAKKLYLALNTYQSKIEKLKPLDISFEEFFFQHNGFSLNINQHNLYKTYVENKQTTCLTFRQAGVTTFLFTLALYRCLSTPGLTISYVVLDMNQAKNIISNHLKNKENVKFHSNKIEFDNRSRIMFVSKGDHLRGYNSDEVLFDNEIFDNEIWYALLPTLNIGGKIILTSPPMQEVKDIFEKSFEKKNNFKFIKLDWKLDTRFTKNLRVNINGDVTSDWLEELKLRLPKDKLDQEILGKFKP